MWMFSTVTKYDSYDSYVVVVLVFVFFGVRRITLTFEGSFKIWFSFAINWITRLTYLLCEIPLSRPRLSKLFMELNHISIIYNRFCMLFGLWCRTLTVIEPVLMSIEISVWVKIGDQIHYLFGPLSCPSGQELGLWLYRSCLMRRPVPLVINAMFCST